ncbi:MAG: type II secretion system F family protein [Thermodesulfobacteriota bacterium]|nr:type II secretion system F family protein [Thermodesulfobacteriota bacterium]
MADLIVLGVVFVAISSAFYAFMYFAFSSNPIKGRLEHVMGIDEHKERISTKFNFFTNIIKCLGRFSSPKEKEDEKLACTKMALSRAGYRGEDAQVLFFGTKTFLTIIFLIIVGLLFFCFADFTNAFTTFYVLLAAVAGFYSPTLWIRWKAKRRAEQVRNGFPDMLDLLVVCMGAGQALDAALNRVGKEINLTNPVLGEEFRLLNLEIRAGKSRKEALRNLANRTGLDDISSLVTLINQSEELGVSIVRTLRVHSDSMRTKRRMRAETIAGRIPVKLTVPLMLFIFPCLMVVIVGPGIIKIARTIILQ